jgi:hypothetical protein
VVYEIQVSNEYLGTDEPQGRCIVIVAGVRVRAVHIRVLEFERFLTLMIIESDTHEVHTSHAKVHKGWRSAGKGWRTCYFRICT